LRLLAISHFVHHDKHAIGLEAPVVIGGLVEFTVHDVQYELQESKVTVQGFSDHILGARWGGRLRRNWDLWGSGQQGDDGVEFAVFLGYPMLYLVSGMHRAACPGAEMRLVGDRR
jgi:hypothetical protein